MSYVSTPKQLLKSPRISFDRTVEHDKTDAVLAVAQIDKETAEHYQAYREEVHQRRLEDLKKELLVASDGWLPSKEAKIGTGEKPDRSEFPIPLTWFRYKQSIGSYLNSASLIITHAGAGSCLDALACGKPTIAVVNPLLHDNHQLELAHRLASDGYLLCCEELDDLHESIKQIQTAEFKIWRSANTNIFANWLDCVLTNTASL